MLELQFATHTRDASWPGEDAPSSKLPDKIRQAIIDIKACVDQDRKFPEICMEVVSDFTLSLRHRLPADLLFLCSIPNCVVLLHVMPPIDHQ